MPIYEYICEKCHTTEEFLQKFDEAAPEECLHCHAKGTLSKSVTTSAFHLKGGGWYKDLYSSNKTSDASSSTKTSSTLEKDSTATKPVKKDD